jgi:hypothetical protein
MGFNFHTGITIGVKLLLVGLTTAIWLLPASKGLMHPGIIKAQDQQLLRVISKTDLKLDQSTIGEGENFSRPRSVLITPIFLPAGEAIDSQSWYKGLFYYLSSYRYNFRDIPFHFVIDSTGNIYEGITGGVERELLVEGSTDRPIHIAYLAGKGDSDFTISARPALERLVIKLLNENSINPENISLAGLALQKNLETSVVNVTTSELFGSWKPAFADSQRRIAASYKPIPRQYKLSIKDYQGITGAPRMGSQVILKVTVVNDSEYTVYEDGDSNLLFTTKSGRDSSLFVNGIWVSKSQLPLLQEGDSIRPGQEKQVELKVLAPFPGGKIKEEFVLRTASGQVFEQAVIAVEFEVDRAGMKVLEVTSTETGSLNVRQNPTVNSAAVGKVSPGQFFEWIESRSGWYKIKYEGRDAWVLGKYVRVL